MANIVDLLQAEYYSHTLTDKPVNPYPQGDLPPNPGNPPVVNWGELDADTFRGGEIGDNGAFANLVADGVKTIIDFQHSNDPGNDDIALSESAGGKPITDSAGDVIGTYNPTTGVRVILIPCAQGGDNDGACYSATNTAKFLAAVTEAKAAGGKIYIHCTSGKDRTGYMSAIYRIVFHQDYNSTNLIQELNHYGDTDPGIEAAIQALCNNTNGIRDQFVQYINTFIQAGGSSKEDINDYVDANPPPTLNTIIPS